MTNQQESPATSRAADDQPPGRRELLRSTDERVIGGVAAGLARYWDVSAGILRVAFLVMTVFGGFGLLLYLGLWLILPGDDGSASVLESAIENAREGESWLGVALITVAIVILVSSVSWIDGSLAWAVALLVVGYLLYQGTPLLPARHSAADDAPLSSSDDSPSLRTASKGPSGEDRPERPPRPPRPPRQKKPPTILGRLTVAVGFITSGILALADLGGAAIEARHYVGALLAVAGFGLLIGAWFGRARWLILVGLLLLPVAVVSRLTDITFDGSFDNLRSETIVIDTAEELDQAYTYDAAEVTFDLTQLPAEETGSLQISVDIGSVTVLLPPDTQTSVSADVAIGDATIGTETSGGLGVGIREDFGGTGGPISLHIEVGIGSVSAYQLEGN